MEQTAIIGADTAPAHAAFNRADLLPALDYLARFVIDRRNTAPILSNVRIDIAPDGVATLRGTDLDVEASVSVACVATVPGAYTVNAAALRDVIKAMNDAAPIALQIERRHDWADRRIADRLNVTQGASTMRLPVLPVDDFPNLECLARKAPMQALAAGAADLLPLVAPFASTEERRPSIRGVAFDPVELDGVPVLAAVATDGHRMAYATVPLGDATAPQCVLPESALKAVMRAAKLASAPLSGECNADWLAFTAPNIRVICKANGFPYPDWRRAIDATGVTPSRIVAAESEPRLNPAYVQSIAKAAGVPLSWEWRGQFAVASSPQLPNWRGIVMERKAPGVPHCPRQVEGAFYHLLQKAKREGLHASRDTSRLLTDGDMVRGLAFKIGATEHVIYPSEPISLAAPSYASQGEDGSWTDAAPLLSDKGAVILTPSAIADLTGLAPVKASRRKAKPVAAATPSANDAAPDDGQDGEFRRRVDYAARVISGNGRMSRAFDNCFEMHDGDAVVLALDIRARKNDRLASNLDGYLCQAVRAEIVARYDGRDPVMVARECRERARLQWQETLAQWAKRDAEKAAMAATGDDLAWLAVSLWADEIRETGAAGVPDLDGAVTELSPLAPPIDAMPADAPGDVPAAMPANPDVAAIMATLDTLSARMAALEARAAPPSEQSDPVPLPAYPGARAMLEAGDRVRAAMARPDRRSPARIRMLAAYMRHRAERERMRQALADAREQASQAEQAGRAERDRLDAELLAARLKWARGDDARRRAYRTARAIRASRATARDMVRERDATIAKLRADLALAKMPKPQHPDALPAEYDGATCAAIDARSGRDFAQLLRERDQARTALAAVSERVARIERESVARAEALAARCEEMTGRALRAEAALRQRAA